MAVLLLTANPRAREVSRQAYLEASAMRLPRPASAPQLRSRAPAVPVTPLQLLRARARPSSAWAPPSEASRADETSVAEATAAAAASLSKVGEDRSEADLAGRSGERCTCEVSESSLVSTQQPLEHSETSQELDLPEEDCDDANEAELQGKVEALRRKDLQERMMKLRQQQKELEEEQQEVQKLLQRTPKRTTGRPQSAASRTRSTSGSGTAELRIDGKAISGTTSRASPKSRPSSSPGALRRSASAPGQRQEPKKSLRDLHYDSMRRQAAQRLELLKQREIQREPWTHGGSRPSRPWSAIPGYTGYRPHMEEDSLVGCNWSRASLQCIRLFGKPGT
mmetsp:Transcript_40643/g.63848  ORF Transcript_40643/g.63848 Transcript_40643/m.63848 type:complete len:337 (+) Transcript_40643:36-1046(+)